MVRSPQRGWPQQEFRPQSARVIFVRTASLDHDVPARVHDEDRESAMQKPDAMNRGLSGGAGGAIALVD
jgi:hypothetical protein